MLNILYIYVVRTFDGAKQLSSTFETSGKMVVQAHSHLILSNCPKTALFTCVHIQGLGDANLISSKRPNSSMTPFGSAPADLSKGRNIGSVAVVWIPQNLQTTEVRAV